MTHKRALIIGSAGFIGSSLATELLSAGHEIVGVDSLSASYGQGLPNIRRNAQRNFSENIEIIDGDISDPSVQSQITSMKPFNTVFHLAAWPGVRGGELDPNSYLKNNIEALCASVRTAQKAEVERFVFASSSSVYGNQGLSGPCREGDAFDGNQLSFYAATKWIGEQILSAFIRRTQMHGIFARFFTVIGPYGRPDMAYASFARSMIRQQPVQVFGDGTALRDYTSISDTVWALKRMCEVDHHKYQLPGESLALNVGFGRSYSVNDLTAAIQVALNLSDVKVEYRPQPPVDALATLSDPTLLHELFGVREPKNLNEMVKLALSTPDWIFE